MSNGNIFTPQVAPYDATQDMFRMYMMQYNMRQRREAQVLNMMKQLDPIELLSDNLRVEQNDMFNQFEDWATKLMHDKKGNPSREDLFEMQYKMTEIEKWQADRLSHLDLLKQQTQIFSNAPGNAPDGYFNKDKFYTKLLDTTINGTEYDNYLEVNPVEFNTFLRNVQLYTNDDDIHKDITFDLSPDKTKRTVYEDIIYGSKDPKRAHIERAMWLTGQLQNNEPVRLGAIEAFNNDLYTTEEERQMWREKAETMNRTRQTKDPIMGKEEQGLVTPESLWAVSYGADKIQEPKRNIKEELTPKYVQEPEPEPGYKPVVLEGDEATFKAYQGVKGGSTEGVGTYAPEKRQSLEPLKTSKNFMLTDQSYIAAYTSELFGKDAKSKIGFADIVGKVGDSHAVSKEGNEILYNQPIYTGEESVTVKSVPMIVNGKKVNKTVVINPGEPITQEVVDAMNNKDPNWEADNVTYEDRAKIVFDFGSKSMIVINPITENLKELFKDFDLYYKPSVAKLKERVEVKEEPKKNTLGKLITPILKTVTGMYGTKKSDWDKYKR